jgi:hypothetical protein
VDRTAKDHPKTNCMTVDQAKKDLEAYRRELRELRRRIVAFIDDWDTECNVPLASY